MPTATATPPPAPPLTGFQRWWVSSTLALRAPAYELARAAYEAGRADTLAAMSDPSLTVAQKRTFDFILAYRAEHNLSPTLQEMADGAGVRKVSIFEAVEALERKGLIRRTPRKSRSIEVVNGNGKNRSATAIGMYDEIICHYPLPTTPPAFVGPDHKYQSKDLACTLDVYTITEDGRLEPDEYDGGFTGQIEFYTSNIVASGPGIYTRSGEDAESVEYAATFHAGRVVTITESERQIQAAMPSSGPTLFDSEEEARASRGAKDDEWARQKKEYDDYAAAWAETRRAAAIGGREAAR